ncbi:MAG TPA: threonine synthase [Bacteroidales bacterium]|nr:threonine synthase [Bacteroidales bacterium]
MSIKYYSTNLQSEKVSFRDALLQGQAPDRGLYMPESIPQLTREQIWEFRNKEYYEIAYEVISRFTQDEIPAADLMAIVKDAYNFQVPLEKVYNRNYIMRLDQGPTASFKDFAARLMGRLMQYFLKKENRKMLILTATSGDTGSAIANAFYGLDNINVVILFPESEVSDRQRKQMTTLNKNIQVLALNGKFDDCQALVKEAFADSALDYLQLSSANSINIGRLIPQSVYYFYAYSRLAKSIDDEIVFSVPSGNFGDLMGGIIAKHMGLPVKRFVISTNANDEVPVYFTDGYYKTIVPSRNCISNAMNVGHPSNMARIVALYGGVMDEKGVIKKEPDVQKLKNDMYAVSISDEHTKATIKSVYDKHKVLLEPHGAVGWSGLQDFHTKNPANNDQLCVSLETAHPAKFPNEIQQILGIDPELPESLKNLEGKPEKMEKITSDFASFKAFLIKNYK